MSEFDRTVEDLCKLLPKGERVRIFHVPGTADEVYLRVDELATLEYTLNSTAYTDLVSPRTVTNVFNSFGYNLSEEEAVSITIEELKAYKPCLHRK